MCIYKSIVFQILLPVVYTVELFSNKTSDVFAKCLFESLLCKMVYRPDSSNIRARLIESKRSGFESRLRQNFHSNGKNTTGMIYLPIDCFKKKNVIMHPYFFGISFNQGIFVQLLQIIEMVSFSNGCLSECCVKWDIVQTAHSENHWQLMPMVLRQVADWTQY